jgi:hypothetical protein
MPQRFPPLAHPEPARTVIALPFLPWGELMVMAAVLLLVLPG